MGTIKGLTHAQMADRRRQISEAVRDGMSIPEAAVTFRTAKNNIYPICRQLGVALPHKYQRPVDHVNAAHWLSADWSKRDCELAALLGVSRERVRQVRRQLGKPNPPSFHQHSRSLLIGQWIEAHNEPLRHMTAAEAARACPLGAHPHTIAKWCHKCGVPLLLKQKSFADGLTLTSLPRFVTVDPAADCWLWNLARLPNGFARLPDGGYPHIHVYRLVHGAVPPGTVVCRTCRNSACVNPAHLIALTRQEAIAASGRHRKSFLTESQVANARKMYRRGEPIEVIASALDRCVGSIQKVVNGTSYGDDSPHLRTAAQRKAILSAIAAARGAFTVRQISKRVGCSANGNSPVYSVIRRLVVIGDVVIASNGIGGVPTKYRRVAPADQVRNGTVATK